jgi:hypothetical protein
MNNKTTYTTFGGDIMKRSLIGALLILGALAVSSAALSIELGSGALEGVFFMTGGVSKGERADMEGMSKDYNLKIVLATAAGAYLAEIPVMIYDGNAGRVLSEIAEGPWFYVRLPEGRYTIEARHEGRTKEKGVYVDEGLEVVLFHWDT